MYRKKNTLPTKNLEDEIRLRKKRFLKMLSLCGGIVSHAAKQLGVGVSGHYNWMNTDAEYRKKVRQIEEDVLDFTESKLHELVQQGDNAAIFFLLKCKGKRRGYSEKTESEFSSQPQEQIIEVGGKRIVF